VTDAELLPCPFCGATPHPPENDTYGGYCVCCPTCDDIGHSYASAEAAVASWNRRAPDLAAHARGAAEERAAVVVWLDLKRRMDPVELGRCIARGEHRREEGG
jgi:Lar family restriction alleviation protein